MPASRSFIDVLPVALYDPDVARGEWLASLLETEGFQVEMAPSAEDLLDSIQSTYFRTVIVMADLGDAECVRLLEELRRVAPESWLLVGNLQVDEATLDLAHQQGIDAVVSTPIDPDELIRRVIALQLRARPTY